MMLSEHFADHEFSCPCCGERVTDVLLLSAIKEMRRIANVPIKINSGYRCPNHNAVVRGKLNSQHMRGLAADLYSVVGVDRLREIARGIPYVHGIGYDPIREFLHVDVRSGLRVEWVYKDGKAVYCNG